MFYYDVASFNVADVPEPFNQGFEIGPLFLGTGSVPKHPDYRNSSRLLRARRERPRCCRAADQRDEIAPFQCPMSPVLPTGRIAHLGMEETAAVRDFNAAYDRSRSDFGHSARSAQMSGLPESDTAASVHEPHDEVNKSSNSIRCQQPARSIIRST